MKIIKTSAKPRALAFLGGMFDPPHHGHVHLARRALRDLPVARAQLTPNGMPPHRRVMAPWSARLEMCELALRGTARVRTGREEPPQRRQWTVHTLQKLRRRYRVILLIVGADAFAQFSTWRRWRQIFALAHIVVAARHGAARPAAAVRAHCHFATRAAQLRTGHGRVYLWRSGAASISSSEIRRRLAAGLSVTELLPPAVLKKIQQEHFYGT